MTEQTLTREQIIETLSKGIVNFKYIKKDGTERIANGTRHTEFIEAQDVAPKGTGIEREGVITYYDIEKQSWRSFNEDSFVEFI